MSKLKRSEQITHSILPDIIDIVEQSGKPVFYGIIGGNYYLSFLIEQNYTSMTVMDRNSKELMNLSVRNMEDSRTLTVKLILTFIKLYLNQIIDLYNTEKLAVNLDKTHTIESHDDYAKELLKMLEMADE